MAYADKTEVVVEPAREAVTRMDVVLTLTESEAQALADVLGKIGGDPYSTRRKLTQNVAMALASIGVSFRLGVLSGSVYFS